MATKAKGSNSQSSRSAKTGFGKGTYLKWYKDMLLMRLFEEKASQLYVQQKFGGFCHLYIGEEAVASGISTGKKDEDRVITAYRDHAYPIALGSEAKKVMAELYGKTTGLSKGKGGSMHMFDKDRNLFGGHGIVGAHIPLGAGIAFADQYRGEKRVTYCALGDGAVRQGSFHETMNMAMNWKLPVVFVIENNNYAMGTAVNRVSNVTELYKLARSYEMPSEAVDGMKCEDVHEAIKKAGDRARKGDGPTLLEMNTYRYKGHSMSDPAKYRTRKELDKYKNLDPIELVADTIKKKKYLSQKEMDKIREDTKKAVEECVKFAEESPDPEPGDLYKDVYEQEDYPFLKEITEY